MGQEKGGGEETFKHFIKHIVILDGTGEYWGRENTVKRFKYKTYFEINRHWRIEDVRREDTVIQFIKHTVTLYDTDYKSRRQI